MLLRWTCRACGHTHAQSALPKNAILTCAACGVTAEARASEDFQSAVEDALAQLWWLSQTFSVELTLDSEHIPEAFLPPPEP